MKLYFIATFAAFIVVSLSTPIEHGHAVDSIRQYPYVVHLLITAQHVRTKNKLNYHCGGILMKPGIVLTAAHCLYDEKEIIINIEVTAGSIYTYRGFDQQRKMLTSLAAGFRIHKKFEHSKNNILTENHFLPHDIAMVWLRDPFRAPNNPNIKTAIFIISDIPANTQGDIVGWSQEGDELTSRVLSHTKLEKISDFECKMRYKYKNDANTFCAISPDGKCGSSIGDSGGPFVYKGAVVGLISYGAVRNVKDSHGKSKDECDMKKPIVFADIRVYREWMGFTLNAGVPPKKCNKVKQKNCAL